MVGEQYMKGETPPIWYDLVDHAIAYVLGKVVERGYYASLRKQPAVLGL